MECDISPLFRSVSLAPRTTKIKVKARMEPPEKDPHNDWLYPGIRAMLRLHNEGFRAERVACIGTGQAIDAIAATHIFRPRMLYATDIVPEILPRAKENFLHCTSDEYRPEHLIFREGVDCEPLDEKVDLIFFNPPPLMVSQANFNVGLARTTLVEAEPLLGLADHDNDLRLVWSTLPHYKFLLSARKKLRANGRTITTYTGRIPFEATEEAYVRAGHELKVLSQFVKFQTDPQYLWEYAKKEDEMQGKTFDFYHGDRAQAILGAIPTVVHGATDASLKYQLRDARITATEAWELHRLGTRVAHVGYALEGRLKHPDSARTVHSLR